MLKIYRAYSSYGETQIYDYISFSRGKFNTGNEGFGEVISGNLSCEIANYELSSLKSFRNYLKGIKLSDGYVENFKLFNPASYEMLEERYKSIPKDFDTYEEYGLNEEGILLFTDYTIIETSDNSSVKRIFGRYANNGLYLIEPNASFSMIPGTKFSNVKEDYEVLQSPNLGKRLSLVQMKRRI